MNLYIKCNYHAELLQLISLITNDKTAFPILSHATPVAHGENVLIISDVIESGDNVETAMTNLNNYDTVYGQSFIFTVIAFYCKLYSYL